MGYKLKPCSNGMAWESPHKKAIDDKFNIHGRLFYNEGNALYEGGNSYLKFDHDYNWLMEVVYKISDIKSWSINATLEWMATEYETDGLYTIKDIFNVCIEFIKWYNQQQK